MAAVERQGLTSVRGILKAFFDPVAQGFMEPFQNLCPLVVCDFIIMGPGELVNAPVTVPIAPETQGGTSEARGDPVDIIISIADALRVAADAVVLLRRLLRERMRIDDGFDPAAPRKRRRRELARGKSRSARRGGWGRGVRDLGRCGGARYDSSRSPLRAWLGFGIRGSRLCPRRWS